MKPIANSIAAMADDLTAWRRDFHQHPELGYEEHRTAGMVAERLRAFGLDDVVTGVGGTGVIGVLHGRSGAGGRAILLRADMDALPIEELSGVEHASQMPGKMHACGHDGHTTMLLGAARHLAETRAFDGTVYFCFQPAEEGGAGAKAMIDDGLFDRFPAERVFGMHNWPGYPVGHFALKDGPVLASADEFKITLTGKGGHGAMPHLARDPIVAGAALVGALQSVVARVIDPQDPAVISVTQFHAGSTSNVIPETADLVGTTRCFSKDVRRLIHAEMERLTQETARAFAMDATFWISEVGYPATLNDPDATDFAERCLRETFGDAAVIRGHPPTMASEDFAFMAQERPGCFVLIGNGESEPLHHPAYDFDDNAAPAGVAFWAGLVERALPVTE